MNRKYNLREIYNLAIRNGDIDDSIQYISFYNFIREFNKKISGKIIEKQYKFNFGIGFINIIKDLRRGKTIDWGGSNKLKQQLIDEGKIPYDFEKHPEGIKWHIYYEDPNYYKWYWYKDESTKFIKNILYWTFKPMSGNRKKVGRVIKDNPYAKLDYALHS